MANLLANAKVRLTPDTKGFEKQVRKDLEQTGEHAGQDFTKAYREQVERAARSLPTMKITADSSKADKRLAELKAELSEAAKLKIETEVDAADALRTIKVLQDAIETAANSQKVSIGKRISLRGVGAQLSEVEATFERIAHDISFTNLRRDLGNIAKAAREPATDLDSLSASLKTATDELDRLGRLKHFAGNEQIAETLAAARDLRAEIAAIGTDRSVEGLIRRLAGIAKDFDPRVANLERTTSDLRAIGTELERFRGRANTSSEALRRIDAALEEVRAGQQAVDWAGNARSVSDLNDQLSALYQRIKTGNPDVETAQADITALATAYMRLRRTADETDAPVFERSLLTLRQLKQNLKEIAAERGLGDLTERFDTLREQIRDGAIEAAHALPTINALSVEFQRAARNSNLNVQARVAAGTAINDLRTLRKEMDAVQRAKELDQKWNQLSGGGRGVSWLATAIISLGPAAVTAGAVASAAIGGIGATAASAVAGVGTLALGLSGIGDAVEAMGKAQKDATEANVRAANMAMRELVPSQQAFAAFVNGLTPAIDRLKRSAADNMLGGFTTGIGAALQSLPNLDRIVVNTAQALGTLAAKAGEALGGPFWQQFLDFVGNRAQRDLLTFGTIIGNVAEGFAGMAMAFGGEGDRISAILINLSARFSEWGRSLSQSEGFRQFLDYARANTPLVMTTLASLADAIANIAHALAILGPGFLIAIQGISRFVGWLNPGVLATFAGGLIGLTIAFKAVTTSIAMFKRAMLLGDVTRLMAGKLTGVAGVLTGPFGIALGAATLGLGIWAAKHAEARQAQAALAETLDKTTGSVTEQTRAFVVDAMQKDGTLAAARRLGINLTTLTDAMLGNAGAQRQITAATDEYMNAAIRANEVDPTGNFLPGKARDADLVSQALRGQNKDLSAAQRQARDYGAAMGSVASAQAGVTAAIASTNPLIEAQNSAMEAFNNTFTGFIDPMAAFNDASRAAEESIRNQESATNALASARERLTDAEASLADARTDQTRQARDAERAVADAQDAARSAQERLNEAREDARLKLAAYSLQLRGASLDERQAELRVKEARQAVRRARGRDRAGARLDVEQAVLDLEETRVRNARLREEAAQAQAGGVEGARNVVDARRGVQDANQAVTDARERQAEQAADSAARIEDAMRSIANAQREFAEATKKNAEAASGSWQTNLANQVKQQEQWRVDMTALAAKVPPEIMRYLAELGPQAAPLVRDLATMSKPELDKTVEMFRKAGGDSVKAMTADMALQGPVLQAVAQSLGIGVASALASELAAGTTTVAGIMQTYGVAIRDAVNPILEAMGKPTIPLPRALAQAANRQMGGQRPAGVNYAAGGFENHQAQINSAGAPLRIWGEPETHGEAYIPLAQGKRTRSLKIWAETGRRLGLPIAEEFAYGGVRPHVAMSGNIIRDMFGVRDIGGVGYRPNASDHPRGLALDFMTYANRAQGDAVAGFLAANAAAHNIKYLIWEQMFNSGNGWRQMADRGSITANHLDHIHASYTDLPGMRAGAFNPLGGDLFALPEIPAFPGSGVFGTAVAAAEYIRNAAMSVLNGIAGGSPVNGPGAVGEMDMPTGPVSTAGNRALGQRLAAARGWTGGEWAALERLWTKESNWNNQAQNPTSTAYGIAQFLNATWRPYGPKTADPAKQIEYGMQYIAGRYGTPSKALAFHGRNNWYGDGGIFDSGGWLMPGQAAVNLSKKPEPVFTNQQFQNMRTGKASVTVNINAPVYGVDDLDRKVEAGVRRAMTEFESTISVESGAF